MTRGSCGLTPERVLGRMPSVRGCECTRGGAVARAAATFVVLLVLALLVTWAAVATEPALAAPVTVRTRDISLTSPHPNPNAVRSIPTQEFALRSVDGGRTWSKPITIGRTAGRDIHDPVTGQGMNIYDTFPAETVAPNGDVYVTWSQPGATSSRIAVARSRNGGRTWSRRFLGVRGQAALPTIGVAGDGTVGVTYYEVAAASRNGFWPTRVILAISRNRGHTWSRRRIGRQFNLLTAGSKARPCCFVGDYQGIARLQNGMLATTPMAKPPAKHKVDVFFSRITTS